MVDPFAAFANTPTASARRHVAITPSDSTDLPTRPRVLYCEGAGTAVIVDEAGTELSYTLAQGQVLLISPVRVKATGTTATVVGWW